MHFTFKPLDGEISLFHVNPPFESVGHDDGVSVTNLWCYCILKHQIIRFNGNLLVHVHAFCFLQPSKNLFSSILNLQTPNLAAGKGPHTFLRPHACGNRLWIKWIITQIPTTYGTNKVSLEVHVKSYV